MVPCFSIPCICVREVWHRGNALRVFPSSVKSEARNLAWLCILTFDIFLPKKLNLYYRFVEKSPGISFYLAHSSFGLGVKIPIATPLANLLTIKVIKCTELCLSQNIENFKTFS